MTTVPEALDPSPPELLEHGNTSHGSNGSHAPLEELSPQLLRLAEQPESRQAASSLRWACERLIEGHRPTDLCNAVINLAAETCSPQNQYSVSGKTAAGSFALLTAAAAGIQLAERQENSIRQGAATDAGAARLCSVLLVSSAATTFGKLLAESAEAESAEAESAEGPSGLGQGSSALAEFWHATTIADPSYATLSWLSLLQADPQAANDALVSAAATRFSTNEELLILPATLPLASPVSLSEQRLFCGVVKQIALEEMDEDFGTDQRMQAQLLAENALKLSPETLGRLEPSTPERLTALATGIAQTAQEQLAPLLLASFEDGLAPEDLVSALALLRAAAYAITSSGPDQENLRLANLLAGIAADAVQLCMGRTNSLSLRYELALAALASPSACTLSPVTELWVPPFDSSGLADTLSAIAEADPEAASEAATAIPPADHESTDTAWCVIRRAAASDYSLDMQALAQVTALERGFRSTNHPARIWFLAAAARSAAQSGVTLQPLAVLAEEILS